jgi:hypothetical protein
MLKNNLKSNDSVKNVYAFLNPIVCNYKLLQYIARISSLKSLQIFQPLLINLKVQILAIYL